MPYINKLIDRNQVMFTTFDELVEPDSTARVINYFIDHIDLGEMGFKNTTAAAEGRPSFPPSNMAKLYLYGYRNKIRSSRKLVPPYRNHSGRIQGQHRRHRGCRSEAETG